MRNSHVLGVDIGAHGALAVLTLDGEVVEITDMATLSDKPGDRHSVIAALVAGAFATRRPMRAYIEFVEARATDGRAGAFAFGDSFGAVQGVAGAYAVSTTLLTPPVWKRLIGIPKGRQGAKDIARSEAIRRWPGIHDQFARKKDDGRAEAALIAVAGLALDPPPSPLANLRTAISLDPWDERIPPLPLDHDHVLGVYIGAKGALALLTSDGHLISVKDMPTQRHRSDCRPTIIALKLADICAEWRPKRAFIELVTARQTDTPFIAFAFGHAGGVVKGVTGAFGIEATHITPIVWKRAIGIPKGREALEAMACTEAMRRWPAKAHLFAGPQGIERAQAALIAVAGLRNAAGAPAPKRRPAAILLPQDAQFAFQF